MNKYLTTIVLSILLAGGNIAQVTGKITGTVIDKTTGEALIGVNLILVGTGLGAATDIEGNFEIQKIPIGNYALKATYIGYNEAVKSDVMVLSARPAIVNFELLPATIELEGVTVTSGYYEQVVTEPISVASFSYEEIRRTPGGFEDVVRALSVIPGVAKQSAGRNDLIVRGGAPTENLYLIDGFVVPNINHFATQGATGGTNSYVDLDFVDNTTFSTGGFSVKFGDKLSSVLGVTIRPGRSDKIGGKALISASQFGVNMEGPLFGKDNFIFSVRRSYLDFIFNAAGFSFVPQYWDGLFKYNYKFDNSNKLSFLFVGALDQVNFNNNNLEDQIDNARILANSQNQYTTGISFRRLFDKGYMDLRIGRNYVNFDSFQKDSLLNPIFLNQSTEITNNIAADFIFRLSEASEINFGAGYELIESKNQIIFPKSFVTSFGDVLPLSGATVDGLYQKGSIYGLYSSTMFNRLVINAGIRGEYFDPLNTKLTLSPRFSARYAVSPVVSFNFSAGIYRQTPAYIWLAYPGNQNLEPIQVEQYIFGADHLFTSDTRMKVEAFYKNYTKYPTSQLRNYLVLANSGAGFGGAEDNFSSFGLEPLTNDGTGYSRGVEFSIQKKASETPVYGIASLTISETKFTALDGIERNGQYNQSVIFNLSAGYMVNATWVFGLKFRYASGLSYTPVGAFGAQTVSTYLNEQLTPSHSLDLRVDRIWDFGGITLVTYLDIQNIYNRKNLNGYRWDFNENKVVESREFGILPTIGISLEM